MTAPAASVDNLLRAAAAHGLPGAAPLPPLPADGVRWDEVIARAERDRVLGLLAAAAADAAPDLAPDLHDRLVEAHERWCVHDLRLERRLLRSADLLEAADIPFAVMKGPAIAHSWYERPADRLFADLDILVPARHLTAATTVLARGLDAEPALPELRAGFDERFAKESLLRTGPTTDAPLGYEFDVHRTLVAGALGLAIPLDELFQDRGSVVVGGRTLPTLGPVPTFLATCYQATIADVPPRLIAARDVVQIAQSGALDLGLAIAAAGRWQARAVMAEAVVNAWHTLGVTERTPLLAWAESYRPTVRERLLLASHRTAGYVYWRQLAAIVVLPGIEPRLRYLSATLAPQTDYLAGRGWSTATHVRAAARALSRPVREPVVRWVRRLRRRYWLPH